MSPLRSLPVMKRTKRCLSTSGSASPLEAPSGPPVALPSGPAQSLPRSRRPASSVMFHARRSGLPQRQFHGGDALHTVKPVTLMGRGHHPHMPTPALLRWRIGEPVRAPAGHRPGDPVTEDLVAEVDAIVQARMQAMLDELAAERAVWSERVTDRVRNAAERARERFHADSARLADVKMQILKFTQR